MLTIRLSVAGESQVENAQTQKGDRGDSHKNNWTGGKKIGLFYQGPEAAAEKSADTSPPAVIAEVSIKPGMTLLWLGTFLILLGGCVAIARRW